LRKKQKNNVIKSFRIKYLAFLFLSVKIFAQEIDIVPALQEVEKGNIKSAETILLGLKQKDAGNPSVIFLDAVLTRDGDEALKKYTVVLEKYSTSKYADAAIYRVFSYYYSLGYYIKAESYLNKLKKAFPESPYIKTADRKIPNVEEMSAPAETKPRPIEQQPKTETKNYNFTIQAGAFLNVENAKKLVDKLGKENLSTEIVTKEIGGSILNVVTVGRFATEEETRSVLNLLEKKFNLKGRVVSSNK
jgi:cell division septation protein DedD